MPLPEREKEFIDDVIRVARYLTGHGEAAETAAGSLRHYAQRFEDSAKEARCDSVTVADVASGNGYLRCDRERAHQGPHWSKGWGWDSGDSALPMTRAVTSSKAVIEKRIYCCHDPRCPTSGPPYQLVQEKRNNSEKADDKIKTPTNAELYRQRARLVAALKKLAALYEQSARNSFTEFDGQGNHFFNISIWRIADRDAANAWLEATRAIKEAEAAS